ncbi:MAG: S9 family peptidase [Melioribacteraceae bacterium]|nr:S9 family peptidase [Melioribacteraceae bacterium]
MKRYIFTLVVIVSLILLNSCRTDNPDNSRLVSFKDRSLNLQPYFEGFPYSGFTPFYEAGKMYYYYQDSITFLKEIDLTKNIDLTTGSIVSDVDFSLRNVWGIRYNKSDENLYWTGDEKNDEILNLWKLNPVTRELKKLTDVPYIFGWRWNDDNKTAYIVRLGNKEQRLGELRILDLNTGDDISVLQDTKEYRFTWGTPSWRPDGTGIITTVLKDADRVYGNIVYVDIKNKSWKLLTDPLKPRSYPGPAYKDWLNNNEFVYYSNENGFTNLYVYNLQKMKSKQLTSFTKDINESELIDINGKKYIFAVLANPIENEIYLIDPENGTVVNSKKIEVNLSILDSDKNKLLVQSTSAISMFRIDELTVTQSDFSFSTVIDTPDDLKNEILHAKVERLEYPTFDTDPATGKTRMLHAFLYVPKNPLPADERIVMIQSFYGGANTFSKRNQILADAGIYVLSPSPRGSDGFGREFSELNDKDLGGNEIIDIIYAAKYIGEKLDVPASRIGVFGGSHGGYATMRLLTFPGVINGIKADFEWGFGISHAGFSDIIHFYENCNIPDWVTKEAGDPKTEADKLRDRSPLYYADKARGKLLLTHGTNDNRVPIEGSLWMADSLKKYGKDFTLVKFEGQGHGIKGLENQITNYKTWFKFLEKVK